MIDQEKQSGMVCCDGYGTAVPAYDIVSYGRSSKVTESFATVASTPRWPKPWVWSTSRVSVSIRS
jgi:hypothetical protein